MEPNELPEDEACAVSVADAATELGVGIGTYFGILVADGMVLEIPGEPVDPRCETLRKVSSDPIHRHVDYCECRFVPVPHPGLPPLE